MSRADFERLTADLQKSPDLLNDLRSRIDDLGGSVQWARSRGYEVTQDELRELMDSDRELSDDELEEAAGGDWGEGTGGTTGTTGGGGG